ncbi:MAG: anaerobic ribonucleoside-triphosphate reductase, partial [Candidatus Jordarchaeaceae archaeon]
VSGSYVNRLAKLDVERFGKKNVNVRGMGNNVYYSTSNIRLSAPLTLDERIRLENMFHPLLSGGHLLNIFLEKEASPEKLLMLSKKICEETQIGHFTFTRDITYCARCSKSFNGIQNKCPNCSSSMDNLTRYSRNIGHYFVLPIVSDWQEQELRDRTYLL